MSDIEYKTGDADSVGAILTQNGTAINLTGWTVNFSMKPTTGEKITIPCTLGGTVSGTYVPATSGGVTIPFSASNTATAGQYRGEFEITNSGTVAHIPSGNNYYTITIWESL